MSDESYQNWLQTFIEKHDGQAGTVHVLDGDLLHIKASVNIPPKVLELTATIPKGKGMAGLAWQRNQPVQTCNLKDDSTGDVRPGAKAVNALAAVALPVSVDQEFSAVVGIAYGDERELSDEALAELASAAATLPLR